MSFPTTRWTLVFEAASGDSRRALSELLSAYWLPLYVMARVQRLSPADAQDAVQSFAAHVLEKGVFAAANPERGKLRHFLKAAFRNFLNDDRARTGAQKRGGDTVSIDLSEAEAFVRDAGANPEAAYQRQWAQLVMRRALDKLEREFSSGRISGDFAIVRAYFNGELQSLASVAKSAQISEAQLKSFLHRARGRYRELLLEETRDTTEPVSAEAELSELLGLLQ